MIVSEIPKLDNIHNGERLCPCCKTWVVFKDFLKHTRNKSGFGTYCKQCWKDIKLGKKKCVGTPNKVNNVRDSEKWCPKCQMWVGFEDFHKDKSSKLGLNSYCKDCSRNKYHSKTDNEKYDSHYRSAYGITIKQYDQMLSDQNFCCGICRTIKPGGQGNRFYIDHDHDTGDIRGLLCHKCNTGLGFLNDSKTTLEAAISYLDK